MLQKQKEDFVKPTTEENNVLKSRYENVDETGRSDVQKLTTDQLKGATLVSSIPAKPMKTSQSDVQKLTDQLKGATVASNSPPKPIYRKTSQSDMQKLTDQLKGTTVASNTPPKPRKTSQSELTDQLKGATAATDRPPKPRKRTDSLIKKFTSSLKGTKVSTKPAKPVKVETSDHARQKVEYAMNNYFDVFNREPQSFAEALQSNQYHIKWTTCANLPVKLYDASVTSSGRGDVYVTAGVAPVDSTYDNVYCYQSTSNQWNILPQSGHRFGVLKMLDGKLNVFGGLDSVTGRYHNKVTTYNNATNTWYKYYPDMLYNRSMLGVVTYRDHVIAMGGASSADSDHDSIEIMNYRNQLQWREVSVHLPAPMWGIKPTISGEDVLIVGFYYAGSRSKLSYQIAADDILSSPDQLAPTGEASNRWTELEPAPHHNTATVPYSSPAVIIGGDGKGVPTPNISLYDGSKKVWMQVDYLTSPRSHVGVALLNSSTIIIIGGNTKGGSLEAAMSSCLSKVKVGTITLNQ